MGVEVEHKNQVGTFGHKDLVVVVDVEQLGWVTGEDEVFLSNMNHRGVEPVEVLVSELFIIDQ